MKTIEFMFKVEESPINNLRQHPPKPRINKVLRIKQLINFYFRQTKVSGGPCERKPIQPAAAGSGKEVKRCLFVTFLPESRSAFQLRVSALFVYLKLRENLTQIIEQEDKGEIGAPNVTFVLAE